MRILIIDSDRRINTFLKSCFAELGYETNSALKAEKGISRALFNTYDLILMDINLPDLSGEEICECLRAKKIYYPIMIMSAEDSAEVKAKYLDLGVDDYIVKPFSLKELVARTRALMRRPYRPYSPIQEIGEFTINIPARTCYQGDIEVVLTKKEFSLLEFFIFNKNKATSRGFIMEHVWDINADPFSNTIETHVRNLRRKIGDHINKKLIVTVPGVGYKLCCD